MTEWKEMEKRKNTKEKKKQAEGERPSCASLGNQSTDAPESRGLKTELRPAGGNHGMLSLSLSLSFSQ